MNSMKYIKLCYIILLLAGFNLLSACSSTDLYNEREKNKLIKEDIISIVLKEDDYLGKKVKISEENNIIDISSIIFEITKENNINKDKTSYINEDKNIEFKSTLAFEFQIVVYSKESKLNFYTYSKDFVFYELVNEKYVAFNGDFDSFSTLTSYIGGDYEE